jgi:predicted ester cyclase
MTDTPVPATRRNKDTLQQLYDRVMNGHDVNAADELITPDRPDHDRTFPPEFTRDREGFKKLFTMFIAAFPDLKFTTDFMVAEGDMVSAFTSVQGTHQGEFMGIPPTGKSFTASNADTCRFTSEGRICEHWGVFEVASMMRQLGVGA